ncbi:hypothetical protein AKJ37_07460 [candidate division MSBL1 archaeon SCGC-AAA259I09]|uniref:Uncharacterized protein n=2 Tax=candidate division MSBL1 TaxID=215777 RepID=A0A133UU36_9EURY|nr:hypothetical protein AKJ37_07460 [candidate division MSBL1 archaeon SCGC-AAA259I09]KXA97741.1 hypothetical protein AKJ38_00305 [candidate division MSBL1 archaeon SCGC-AAA259I14]
MIIDKTQKVNRENGKEMCPKFKKCPKCGGITLVYDPVKQVAYCRSSICSFREEVGDKVSYNTKFG